MVMDTILAMISTRTGGIVRKILEMPSEEESDYITARKVQQRAFVPMADTPEKPTTKHSKLFLTKLVAGGFGKKVKGSSINSFNFQRFNRE